MSEKQQQKCRYTLKKPVVMIGMMGAGKTAVGKALAHALDVPFLDSDSEIEEAANMTVQEVFARDGEAFFRQKETQVIERLLDGRVGVISTGGGAFLAEVNRRVISAKGVSVWLNAELDVLWERVRHRDTRPLLKTANPYETLKSIFLARRDLYALADLSVTSDGDVTIDAMAARVIAALSARQDVLETKERA